VKYKLLIFLWILVSINVQAGTYTLDNNSSFTNSNGISQLTGTLSLDFPFGFPPLPGSNISYVVNHIKFNENTTSIIQSNVINAAPVYPIVFWPNSIALDSKNNITSGYDVVLSLTETTLGTNLYQYREDVLQSVNINDTSFNSFTVGSDSLPSSLLLTYEWHTIILNAQAVSYPAGEIGPAWQYNTLSNIDNGTLILSSQAASVPESEMLSMFVLGLLSLGVVVRKNA